MNHEPNLERELRARIKLMQNETVPVVDVHTDPESVAEPTDQAPTEFGKGT